VNTPQPKPPILYGAITLAVLSLAWSAYSITDLMDSGAYGLTVALAGDIGWITVLWAEAHRITIAGRTWPAAAAGWLIAIGVGVLLAVHGAAADEHATAQAIAGPFVVAVGKVVWLFALAATRDPAGPTAEQQNELNTVMRDSAHEAAMLHARAEAEIARIRAQASVTLARDETDFEISLERIDKRAELQRRTPLALTAGEPGKAAPEPAEPKAQSPAEPQAQAVELIGSQTPSILTSSQAAPPEPHAWTGEPEDRPFGFSAHLSAQSAQRAQAVAKVAELLAQDPGLTSGQVAEELAVSPATAKRYLREARSPKPATPPTGSQP
jgi:hypothetical protein